MKLVESIPAVLLLAGLLVLTACGGGGGGGAGNTAPPPPPAELRLNFSNPSDQTQAVATDAEIRFAFDADLPASIPADRVELRDAQGLVATRLEGVGNSLMVRPVQALKMRTDYTLTVKAGLTASNGASLRADIERRFKTILFDAESRIVHPGNQGWNNYSDGYRFVVGDLNGDGRPDIVQFVGEYALAEKHNSFAINILLQNPDNSFTRSQNLHVIEDPQASSNRMGDPAIIDLDLDGRPEIVLSIVRPEYRPSGLMVLKQDAQGRYAVDGLINTPLANKLFLADIDRDGKQDVLLIGLGLARTDGQDLCGMQAVLSRSGGPQAQAPTVLPCGLYEAALGALERPDRLNLLLLEPPPNPMTPTPFLSRLRIYDLDTRGQPTLNAKLMEAASSLCQGLHDCEGPMLLDLDGDRIQELFFRRVPSGVDANASTVVYQRSAQGPYVEQARVNYGAYAYLIGDIDRDGRDDITAVLQASLTTSIGVGFTRPAAPPEFSHRVPVIAVDQMSQRTATLADMDGDGLLDVVLHSYNHGLVVVTQKLR